MIPLTSFIPFWWSICSHTCSDFVTKIRKYLSPSLAIPMIASIYSFYFLSSSSHSVWGLIVDCCKRSSNLSSSTSKNYRITFFFYDRRFSFHSLDWQNEFWIFILDSDDVLILNQSEAWADLVWILITEIWKKLASCSFLYLFLTFLSLGCTNFCLKLVRRCKCQWCLFH